MRYLVTLLLAALSFNAVGQGIPQLPYNPDATEDGFIGSPDLLELLSLYGEEFSSAILSEDQESAIVYMGDLAHPLCNLACDNLPGFWNMSTMDDLGLVWNEVANETIWVLAEHKSNDPLAYIYDQMYYSTNQAGQLFGCYCATHELPKVEYKIVIDNYDFNLTEFASQGWKLLNLGYMDNNNRITGVMWRWAE